MPVDHTPMELVKRSDLLTIAIRMYRLPHYLDLFTDFVFMDDVMISAVGYPF